MKTKGVSFKIEEEIKAGVSREELEKRYKKGTVTKVINKLEKNKEKIDKQLSKENNISNDTLISQLIKTILEDIDINNEYEIKISVSKKKNISKKNIREILDPFKLYYNSGKEILVQELKMRSKEELIVIIKKYFRYNRKTMINLSVEGLAQYILEETKKAINIGECFI